MFDGNETDKQHERLKAKANANANAKVNRPLLFLQLEEFVIKDFIT